ncbi:unnamed protein product [Peniophora sp. CBMAI 1063]|nr:unnamed protein product [Peniophora sp. CBMAI 1063]
MATVPPMTSAPSRNTPTTPSSSSKIKPGTLRTSPRKRKPHRRDSSPTATAVAVLSPVRRREEIHARLKKTRAYKERLIADKREAEEGIADVHETYRAQLLELIKHEPEAQNVASARDALAAVQAVITRIRTQAEQAEKKEKSAARRATKAESKLGKSEERSAGLERELDEAKRELGLERMTLDAVLVALEDE